MESEVRVRSLETLGVPYDSYAFPFVSLLVDRLPRDIRIAWYRSTADKETRPDVKDVLAFLRKEVISQDRGRNSELFSRKRGAEEGASCPRELRKVRFTPSAAALTTVSKIGSKQDRRNECIFCHLAHSPLKCVLPLEKRLETVKREKRCFACLRSGHRAAECRNPNPNCRKCQRRHHAALCRSKEEDPNHEKDHKEEKIKPSTSTIELCTSLSQQGEIYLKTATVFLYGPLGTSKATCLVDEGSQRSYVTERMVNELGLDLVGTETVSICGFGSRNVSKPSAIRCFRLRVSGTRGKREKIELNVLTTRNVCPDLSAPRAYTVSEIVNNHLADERIGSLLPQPASIDLLIGADYCQAVVNYKTISCKSGLLAVSSKLGWLIFGREKEPGVPNTPAISLMMAMGAYLSKDEADNQDLRHFWDLEHFGITDPHQGVMETNPLANFEERVIRGMEGRYSVPLPWRQNKRDQLKSNYYQAAARLRRLLQRLQQDPNLLQSYHEQILQYLQSGFISKVDSKIVNRMQELEYYLPHRPVVRQQAVSTKIRPVFDASARGEGGHSLNDCLETGENLNPELLAVLLRFRWNRVAWVGDIEKAFLQVEVHTEDRNALRFLWIEDLAESERWCTYRWNRVTFGLSPSPYLLRIVIRKHLRNSETIDPQLARYLENNLYMDDLLAGSDSVENAITTIQQAVAEFNSAHMRLTKWVTNAPELKVALGLPDIDAAVPAGSRLLGNKENSKVLGVIWKPDLDCWTFDHEKITSLLREVPKQVTKRQMLSISSKLFDPLGLCSPVLLLIKLQFQRLWESGIPWDAPIPADLQRDWSNLINGLSYLTQMQVPRWYFHEIKPLKPIQLHVFCDASQKGYGAVAYLRSQNDQSYHTCLVTSKTRVAPTKKITLPRLELLGALLASRLANYILQALQCPFIVSWFWCDSTVALGWIQGNLERWKPFVQNRVEEIRKYSQPDQWRHCPGGENPADVASKGCSAEELLQHTEWCDGPYWLRGHEGSWPKPLPPTQSNETRRFLEAEERRTTVLPSISNFPPEDLFPLSKYSSFERVLRITSWIFRFLRNRKKSKAIAEEPDSPTEDIKIGKGHSITVTCLTGKELDQAELFWIRSVQRAVFPHEFDALRHGRTISKTSPIAILRPLFDKKHAVVRVTSRLTDLFAFEERTPPILLPTTGQVPADRIIELMIWNLHLKCLHASVNLLLIKMREKYWLIKGRQQIKKVIGICGRCKRAHCRPYSQPMGGLPLERITEMTPFLITGVDFMGPVYVKPLYKGKSVRKVYVCLFVCPVTRAVQLELVSSLSAETFLLALERLIADKRDVQILMSDHGSAFLKTARQLNDLWNNPRIASFLAGRRMKWQFIPPAAPWWGGFWERLIRSIKDTLKKSLGFQCLNYEEMVTHLKSMQAVINSRPLARDVDSPNDSAFYVTPSDLLIGRRAAAFPSSVDLGNFDLNEDPGKLSKRLRHQKQVFDRAWKSWTNCYQRDLRNFAQRDRPGSTQPIRVGQIVMIRDDLLPRLKWKVGLVTNLHVGRDGRVRMVDLRLPSGNSTTRAIQSLYSLENDVPHADSQAMSDSPCSQRKLHFELPLEGNSRGECKEMEVDDGNAASTNVGNNNPNLDATRTLRSGRPHCLKPYL